MTSSVLPIWKLKDPQQSLVLRAVAVPLKIDEITQPETQTLIDRMVLAMYRADGIGLAAPQIGRGIRLAVIAKEIQGSAEPLVLINPTLENLSSQQVTL